MPSKGVDYYAYLGRSPFSVTFEKPTRLGWRTETFPVTSPGAMSKANLQIYETDIGLTEHTGRFRWTASRGGATLESRYADIAPLTGEVQRSDMATMMATPSVVTSGYALSYGFYDAGTGVSGLTNQDQSYVYLTDNYANWMGSLAPVVGNKPFTTFALPGAHDAGMYEVSALSDLVANSASRAALALTFGPVVAALGPSALVRAVTNLAVTQKDKVSTMLDLGIRYFDFRPGTCYKGIVSGIYHQHNFIPGVSYQTFLADLFGWLKRHPSEIVVLSPNFQGFAADDMKPSVATLDAILRQAQAAAGATDIKIGTKSDLGATYQALVDANERLLVLDQVGSPDQARKYDSYGDAYKTTNPGVVLDALEGMSAAEQAKYDYTVLQLQGTATGLGGGIFSSVVTASDASSPLMSTKANFDHATYPWLAANVPSRFAKDKLLVYLNDFADNALVAHAIATTSARARG